ncbi:MAG: cytochrome C [bacterium]
MSKGVRCLQVVLVLSLVSVSACVSMQRRARLMAKHPDVEGFGNKPPVCTECHDSRGDTFAWEKFDHAAGFGERHGAVAHQNEEVCAMCHKSNFCSDCHGNRVELKPSVRNQRDTFRKMPHRGDYLARHRIDGRVDPTSCVRCHGNSKTSETCVKCHG